MSGFNGNLRHEFQDKEYRHVYADEALNAHIATQIKVLREQQELTQRELAKLAGMAQPRIAVLEDVNYSSWSINTLRRLARAFDLRLSVKFETFSSLISELDNFSRKALERDWFERDVWFHKKAVQPAASAILAAAQAKEQQHDPALQIGARALAMSGAPIYKMSCGAAAIAAGE